MRRSFLVRVGIVGSLLLGLAMVARCGDPVEECWQLRTCGGKTLSGCTNYSGCRYKSSDGHAWSCSGDKGNDGYGDYSLTTCNGPSCATAAQEAVDWCFGQTTGSAGTSGMGGATGSGGSGGSGGTTTTTFP
jgi:hypothetical protein